MEELVPLIPTFLSYVLSFVYVGIYWNNHHHLLHTCTAVTGAMLWANLHLLFWLSLFPFATGWMGQNHFAEAPTVPYGVVLLMAAIAYCLLEQAIMRPRAGLNSETSGALSLGDRSGTALAADRRRGVRGRCVALADPRPAHRKRLAR